MFGRYANLTKRVTHGGRKRQPMLQMIQQFIRHHVFERAGAQLTERLLVIGQFGLLDNGENPLIPYLSDREAGSSTSTIRRDPPDRPGYRLQRQSMAFQGQPCQAARQDLTRWRCV